MQITQEKKALRKEYRQLRKTLKEKDKKDLQILNRLKELNIYNNYKSVFVYVSSPIEVDTHRLIESLLKSGIKVAVPLCDTEKCTMEFYYINSMSDLIFGAYNILEPDKSKCRKAQALENTICIVPGLSFDKNGYRLGFGKGYYDRFLSKFDFPTVGLCYEECIRESVPHDNFDKRVSVVVTENNIYKCTDK